jgi:flagellar FliL protein
MDEATGPGKAARKWSARRWLLLVAAVLFLAVAGYAARRLFHRRPFTANKEAKAEFEVRAILHLEPFLVNLADPDGDRFLRVGIDLGLERDLGEKKRGGESALPLARTRDAILTILTTCKADTLMAPAGKAALKNELTRALREHAPELGVREVYFTEFLVQR